MHMRNQLDARARPRPGFPTSSKGREGGGRGGGGNGSLQGSFGDANCMEQLLVHCANAIDNSDGTLAQQLLWVLNNIAFPDGDSNQRLAAAFLRALTARAAKIGGCEAIAAASTEAVRGLPTHSFSVIDLAGFIDLTPWHRFGFAAANAAIIEAVEGFSCVHLVDLSVTHCMQLPTLIDALAARPEGPPFMRLTVAGHAAATPPTLGISYHELGARLVNFARFRNVAMEFRIIPCSSLDGFSLLIDQVRYQRGLVSAHDISSCSTRGRQELIAGREALVINCQMMMRCVPNETVHTGGAILSGNNVRPPPMSIRSMCLKKLRSLDPNILILVDEEADFTSSSLVCRLRSAFNYLWIPYDIMDTFLPRGSKQRVWYEADLCWKVGNVIAQEGVERVERAEPKSRWAQRMQAAGFRGLPFREEAVTEVQRVLDEHAAGWGLKREENHDLLLTWKGHNVVFASAWVPYH